MFIYIRNAYDYIARLSKAPLKRLGLNYIQHSITPALQRIISYKTKYL
jgi:hypothetical protein